jgi:UDP-N-acetylmuramyl tripeptide synthase
MKLGLEVAAARAVGSLSRLTGRGGGTTLPGKVLATLDPAAVERLAARLPRGCVTISATNGKTTTAAMVAEILDEPLAYNRSGANLLSGVASALVESRGAQLGLFEVDEAALAPVSRLIRPRIVALGNLFRDQLDRYGELEIVAQRWRATLVDLPAALVVVNADDPLLWSIAREHDDVLTYGIDDPRLSRPALAHAADSAHCPSCGTPLVYAAIYVGHLGEHRCPGCGSQRGDLDVAASSIQLRGLEGSSFALRTRSGTATVELALPGLYNIYNATAAAAVTHALGSGLDAIVAGLRRFVSAFGRFERIVAGDRSVLTLLIKNPAGANEAVATLCDGAAPTFALVALNDEIADGRDTSWIWDVDFEPLLATLERVVVSGSRAAELALRFAYGGMDRTRIEVEEDLERAFDRSLALTPTGGELVVLPTYTAMLALRGIAAHRGLVKEFWRAPQ